MRSIWSFCGSRSSNHRITTRLAALVPSSCQFRSGRVKTACREKLLLHPPPPPPPRAAPTATAAAMHTGRQAGRQPVCPRSPSLPPGNQQLQSSLSLPVPPMAVAAAAAADTSHHAASGADADSLERENLQLWIGLCIYAFSPSFHCLCRSEALHVPPSLATP